MRALLLVFSQTGNTRKVGRKMACTFGELGWQVDILQLLEVSPLQILGADAVGIGSPCFGGAVPQPVRQALGKLETLQGKKTFVFATAGGAPGRVLVDLATIVKAKGAEVMAGFLCRGECHFPVPAVKGRFPGRPDGRDLQAATYFSNDVASCLQGNPVDIRGDALVKMGPLPGFYGLLGLATGNPTLQRLVLPKPYLLPGMCSRCGWCWEHCPVEAIVAGWPLKVRRHCIRCYNCLRGCPRKAWDAKLAMANAIMHLIYSVPMERLLGDIKPWEQVEGINEEEK